MFFFCYFQVSKEYDDMTLSAVFTNTSRVTYCLPPVSIILNDEMTCAIPQEVLQKNTTIMAGVYGIHMNGKIMASKYVTLNDVDLGAEVGDRPKETTPSVYEQMLIATNDIKTIAQSVRDDADNGLFKGNDGYTPIKGVDYFTDIDKQILLSELIGNISPEMHCRIFRGKNLGPVLTVEQIDAIRNGSFVDMFLGDYWEINNVKWRIVDIDYWYDTGANAFKTHHVVIMPDTCLYKAAMNDEYTTAGGYVGSKMYTTGLTEAKSLISDAFGDLVLTHDDYFCNEVKNGKPFGTTRKDSTVELPSEIMIYGTSFYNSGINDGTTIPFIATLCRTQLALFNIAPKFICNHDSYWLRDIVSSREFANVHFFGYINHIDARYEGGVRPVFCIG